jgi:hypothetical protein
MVLVERKLDNQVAFIFALAVAACTLMLFVLTRRILLSMFVGILMGALLGWGGLLVRSFVFAMTPRAQPTNDTKNDGATRSADGRHQSMLDPTRTPD